MSCKHFFRDFIPSLDWVKVDVSRSTQFPSLQTKAREPGLSQRFKCCVPSACVVISELSRAGPDCLLMAERTMLICGVDG